ncbi:MAG: Nif11-like leader peptide family natural product precursor [Synergistaceae bacterium]|nr:Nif11-like leader peptide family natural product precursor [Synergistaceae bacterium]
MEQMKAFIEKAKNDKALMAKLDELGASGAEADKIVALAAEHGFAITAEDYRLAEEQAGTRQSGELKEEELEAVAGGSPTQNRWDPVRCGQATRTIYECVGFIKSVYCDHYRVVVLAPPTYQHSCAMGRFDYKGYHDGEPTKVYDPDRVN